MRGWLAACAPAFATPLASSAALAATDPLEEVVIIASREQWRAPLESSSEGVVLSADLEDRPLLRPGEVLESVPGLVVTQHSGDGKANQYFLRGFNLDHGTDFATSIDGQPLNLPTHAHGQGYTDLNPLIPELIDRIEYRKGPYAADQGDFSSAGAAQIHYLRKPESDFVALAVGDDDYRRGVAALSSGLGDGDLMLGWALARENGPWVVPERFRSAQGILKLSRGDETAGGFVEATGYDGRWHSSDQIPQRAVDSGVLPRFGTIDPSDGGAAYRYSLSAERWLTIADNQLRANAYAAAYRLDLYSNFTYFEDPVHGDQFEQLDQRRVYGGGIDWQRPLRFAALTGDLSAGITLRNDHISPVALYDTTDRVRWRTVSVSRVNETSYAAFVAFAARMTPWMRADLGLRGDSFDFRVGADRLQNSGHTRATIGSPKAGLAFGPWVGTEFFVNVGRGFHSNDARGTTMTLSPTGAAQPVSRVAPLARTFGAELGVRATPSPRLMLAATLWSLRLDSELSLDNDASAIVPNGATRRSGLEFSASYHGDSGLALDANYAWTHARYIDAEAAGQYLPNSLDRIASIGLGIKNFAGGFGGLRLRYFGAAPITQDGAVRSRPSLQLSFDLGYQWTPALSARLEVFNFANRRDDDIEYYYPSQLRRESTPVSDIHFHPSEPRSLRVTLRYRL